MYDIIGDIHGYSKTLIALLEKLGYENKRGYYAHPNRKVIFVGDFVDRGPDIRGVLSIVKSMIDAKTALSVLGNHEYNAICMNTLDANGNYLRSHSDKNLRQHKETIDAFRDYPDEWKMYVEWFRELPIFIELPEIRIIHATWDFELIKFIKNRIPSLCINEQFIQQTNIKGTKEHEAVEILLKGREILLPDKKKYTDKDGTKRRKIRIKWWQDNHNKSYRDVAVNYEDRVSDLIVMDHLLLDHVPYSETEKPIFIGHYWKNGTPHTLSKNVACVDYSVAKESDLVAYRWNGEQTLSDHNFLSVKNQD